MPKLESIRTRLFFFLIVQLLVLLAAAAVVSATSQEPALARRSTTPRAAYPLPSAPTTSDSPNVIQATTATTLEVSILSSPWAILDHNTPETRGPHVLIVEAVVTNTGQTTATNPIVTLDYDEDPVNNWVLLEGEDPVRELPDLASTENYHIYWFATYTTTLNASHRYTVTANADNADEYATSQNVYRPTADTVQTRRALEGGSTRLEESTSEIIVGAAFTTTVKWDLGTNFDQVLLSPVGNVDFDPSSYRLAAASVTFLSETVPIATVYDRLYFDEVPAHTTHAQGEYVFLALRAIPSQACPYAAPLFGTNFKYDNAFCETAIPIAGTLSLSLTKQVDTFDIQQGQQLTYTISYTNNGPLPLGNVWIWDNVDPEIGHIIPGSIAPLSDPDMTTGHRVAWYVGGVTESGQPGSTGSFTFSIAIDGGGQDLTDLQPIINHAFFGIDPAVVPENPALTSTVTTTVHAPAIAIAKTDGLDTVRAGEQLTYTLRITNSGSVTATSVVITDHLPSDVTHPDGPVLSWNLDPLPPFGGTDLITIPVTVAPILPDGSILTNTMMARFHNAGGYWIYDTATATDTTTVSAPFWVLTKTGQPDPVVAGEVLTYTLQYNHNGVVPAQNVSITDTLSTDVTYGGMVSQSAAWDPPTYLPGSPATLTWFTPTLDAGASGTLVFTVTVHPDASSPLANEVVLSSTDPATDTTDIAYTTVQREADLAIDKAVSPTLLPTGATITYTLAYDNHGPSDAQTVQITDTMSAKLTFGGVVSTTPPLADPQLAGNQLTWSIPTLSAEASGTIVYTASVSPAAIGIISNTVVITSTTPEKNTANNEAGTEAVIGDPTRATIYGYIFEDANGNGLRDDGELPIPDVLVTLNGTDTTYTDQGGLYVFIVAEPGIYTVVETDPDGYFSTTPNEVHVTVELGNSYRADFGDAPNDSPFAAIYGTVFDDANRDGQWDGDELGIQDVSITLSGDDTTSTNFYGSYTLSTTQATAHTVVETDPVGYMSTTPNEVDLEVQLGYGYQVDFGDFPSCTCAADEYEEDDEWELATELTVAVTQTHDFCDDPTDWLSFTVRAGFVYTITTHSWGQRADTILLLYHIDSGTGDQTLLASSDDFPTTDDFSSRIIWAAPFGPSDVYYVRASSRGALVGCDTDYDIGIAQFEQYYLFLPIIMRNFSPGLVTDQAAAATGAGQAHSLDLTISGSPGTAPESVYSPLGTITHVCSDTFEVDDTWEQAKPIADGELQVHSFDSDPVHWLPDKDFVSFYLHAGRSITFTVPVITGTWEVQLLVYDQSGDPMPETATSTGQLVWQSDADRRYYLGASPPEAAAIYGCADVAGYKLRAELEPRWFLYLPIVTRQAGTR